ncbi:MAG: hypothetical protein WC397_01850 [Candidatus Paceibacterota bacterium]|jgi:hypothetical protein
MAIEVSPKKQQKPLWQTIIFVISLILLIVSLAAFLLLKYYFTPRIVAEITGMNTQIEAEGNTPAGDKTMAELENEVKAFERKSNDFKTLYDANPRFSKFFPAFEETVHPKVSFSSFSISADQGEVKASLNGRTDSYESLIQQMEIFQALQKSGNFIKSFEISSIGKLEKEEVSFSLFLNVQPSVIKK